MFYYFKNRRDLLSNGNICCLNLTAYFQIIKGAKVLPNLRILNNKIRWIKSVSGKVPNRICFGLTQRYFKILTLSSENIDFDVGITTKKIRYLNIFQIADFLLINY